MRLDTATTILGSAAALLSMLLGLFAFGRRREAAICLPFAFLMLANAVYAGAYTLEINSPSLEIAIARIKVEYIGVVFVPVFWFLFARAFVDEARAMTASVLVPISIIPVATIVLMWTNEAHGLVYGSLRIRDPGGPLSVLSSGGTRGPWFWANTVYLYALLLSGTVAIIARLSRASGKFRGQILAIAAAIALPWIGHLALVLDIEPHGFDFTPFLTTASGGLFAYSIVRFNFLDLAPIAREAVLDAICDGVIVIDRKGRFVDANEAARTIFPGLVAADPGSDARAILEPLGLIPGEEPRAVAIDRAGSIRHYKVSSVGIKNGRGEPRGASVIVHETTETVELLARLEKLVATDELTQVDNRRRFFELAERELERAMRRRGPISFAMLDLDNFKRVNDERGHAAGDEALVAACRASQAVLRSTDILCRYGGEEFVIILPDAAPAAALEIIERVRRSVEATEIGSGIGAFSITVSVGVAGSSGPPYLKLEDYLKRSDEALYRAKAAGRNRSLIYCG